MNGPTRRHGTPSSAALWLLSFLCCFFSPLAACLLFPFGALAAQETPPKPGVVAPKVQKQLPASTRLSLADRKEILAKVWKEIRDHYYDPSLNGVNWQEVRRRYAPLVDSAKNDQEFYALMSQMTSELHDAHTRFNSPEQWKNFRRQLGITVGFNVDDVDGKTVVTSVLPGSRAAHAGIEPGMVVLGVDGMPITERISEVEKKRLPSSSDRATRWFIYNRVFAGPRDTEVNVKLQRADGSILETSVTREMHSAAPEVITHVLPSGNVYIRFDGFERPITKEFREALQKFRNAPGLIIDLRRNGGGDLAVLLPIAGYFFSKKTLFAKDATRSGRPLSSYAGLFKLPLELYVGKPGAQIYSGPVIVLVDSHSASSSELFAAGMQDTGRAKILGSQSCGCVLGIAKPRVVKGGGVLEMSEVLWFSPQGRKLEGTGIIPDEVVVPSVADLRRGRDAVLAEADKSLVKAAVLESQGSLPSSPAEKKSQRE
jgi:carboxyl-terminal processing protease